ncbi:esterase FE4-like [Anthonomus grandis grandis]|uniref:esterase FE4-like n=1 Tax=Anthonomus grandis grandis TaxID=2921223 RepID=UPI002165852D|nr:esterase FE4-like [Anthonomus grandis grandis]
MCLHYKLYFIVVFFVVYSEAQGPIVTIDDGQILGSTQKSVGNGGTFYAFKGIPYAKPPVRNLRFQAPYKNDPWQGVLDATKEKDKCVQTAGILGLTIAGSEDCLHLNVYTTNVTGNNPVMVWIFGGGFSIGGSEYSSYAPDFLMDRNIVFVSLNYRLGAFGFLSTGDLNCPGNWGLKDQLLALKWVKDNIEAFGGDPEKITIAGQSAGSASVSYILQNPQSKGLYRSAIMQSGSSLCLWSLTRTAREIAFAIGARLGIFTTDSGELIRKLRKVDYQRLKRAENDVYYVAIAVDNIFNGIPMGPVVEPEHEGAFFTQKSHEMLRTGQFNKVPVLMGLNSNEAKSFLGLFIDVLKPLFTRYDINIARLAPYDLTRNSTKRILAGTEIKHHYFGEDPIVTRPSANIIKFISHEQFNRPIRETVHQMSKYVDVYYYEFGYRGSLGEFESDFAGVGHYEEIFYQFANKANANDEDKSARTIFLELWSNFIKYVNPTPKSFEGATWIPNSPKNQNKDVVYLSINTTLAMRQNPDQEDWEFYQKIYDKYGDPPFSTY